MSLFSLSMALYHVALLVVTAWLARGWLRDASGPGSPGYAAALVRDAAVLAGSALLLGIPAAATAWPHPFFGLARLLCQALFGEGVVLSLLVSAVHVRRRHWERAMAPAVLALGLLAAYTEAYHLGPARLEVRRDELRLPGSAQASPRLRVAHLSDLQTPAIGPHERRAVAAVRAASPDLVLLTGDYLQGRGRLARGSARDFHRLMSTLTAPLGVFAVPGDVEKDCRLFEGTHVVCLEDAVHWQPLPGGRRLAIVGLSAGNSRHPRDATLARLLAEAEPADLRFVMGHAPDFAAALREGQVDLALAGHTHGGQVVLPGIGPLITLTRLPRRLAAGGLNELNGVPLNVSRGIGMERGVAPQVRFLCPPELSLIDVAWPGPPVDPALRADTAPDPPARPVGGRD